MLKLLFFSIVILTTSQVKDPAGVIYGKIVDSETGEPLPVVNIMLVNTTMGTVSDIDGNYRINSVPVGTYSIVARMMGYSELTIENVEVEAKKLTKIDFALTPEAIQMEPMIITAKRTRSTIAALLNSQKKSEGISSGISSEEISNSPDSKASDVLKRVTGLSVVDDKYIYVRGLSERYSKARLNGSTISTPEPDKRVVPFDIFPASLLDNIVIAKSYLPHLPGDFAGGCIQMSTKDFTEKLTGKLSTSFGYNSITTFKDFQTYKGGRFDFLGIDNGIRDLPNEIKAVSGQEIVEGGQFGSGFTSEEIEKFGESFRNIWSPFKSSAPVDQSYSFSIGNRINFLSRPLGFLASLTYKNGFLFHEEERFYYVMGANDLEARHHYEDFKVSNMNIQWGGILNLSYKLSPLHKLGLKTTYTRTADDEVRIYAMLPNRDHNLDEICTRLRWIERSVLSTGLNGEHKISFFDSKIDWKANYSFSQRDEPDTRETLYESDIDADSFRLADESNSGRRFFSYLTDHSIDAGTNMEIPLKQWRSLSGKLKIGSNVIYKHRNINSRRFRFKPQDFNDVNIYQEPEDIFTPENIGDNGFQLDEITRPTDNYTGEQLITSGFLMLDMPVIRKIRMAGGIRIENYNQRVKTYDLFNPDYVPVVGELNTVDILPSLNLTYKINGDMNMRFGFSQTVSRPSFRELSDFEFTDIGGHAVVGNPDLKRTLIRNYDVRWEWYPGIAEHVAIALFYKDFKNPIEKTLINATELTSSWNNARSAYNYGGELELRKNLGFISYLVSDFYISGNLAIIESQVELDDNGTEAERKRPLEGQSPYVINLNLEFSNKSLGTDITLLYNVFGRRITEVGIAGTPDIYEEPYNKFDLVVKQAFSDRIELKFKAKNLLDEEVLYTQGDKIQRQYTRGRSFSCGLSYSL